MQRQPEPRTMGGDIKTNLNLFLGVCGIHATFLSSFLRICGSAGERHFACGLGMLGPVVVFFLGPLSHSVGLMRLGLAQLGFLLIHRAFRAWNEHWRGELEHSRYVGTSWFSVIMPDRLAKRLFEPLACVVLGLLVMHRDKPLGLFLAAGGVSLGVIDSYLRMFEKAQRRDMRDAAIYQQYLSDRIRRG